MRKLLIIGILACMIPALAFAGHESYGKFTAHSTRDTVSPDDTLGDGDVYIEDNLEVDGNCNFDGNVNIAGTFTRASGFVVVTDVFDDVPATNETGHFSTAIASQTLVDATTTFLSASGSAITQPVIPMNVVVFASAAATAQADLDMTGTLTITGYDGRGVAQTEAITVSSAAASGVCAWSHFTSFAFSGFSGDAAGGAVMMNIGVGTILGLGNAIATAGKVSAGGDVIWAQLNDSGTTSTDDGTVSATYNTWTPDTAGDGSADVYTIRYVVDSR